MFGKKMLYQAIDGVSLPVATNLLADWAGWDAAICGVKVHDLYDRYGTRIVESIRISGFKPWIDVKLHDVPRTVGRRAAAIFEKGAQIVTVMAEGGIPMMAAAVEEANKVDGKIYAVTKLTSLSPKEVWEMANLSDFAGSPEQYLRGLVVNLAKTAAKAGVHGIVCSGQEVGELSQLLELKSLDLVVPGTRLPGGDVKDQKRVVTQREAIIAGATHLVAGSEVVEAEDGAKVIKRINEEIVEGLQLR